MVVRRIEEPLDKEELRQMRAMLDELGAAVTYLNAHRQQLTDQHPDQWVAVTGAGLVATASSRVELAAQLRAAGLDPSATVREFLTTEPEILIL